MCTNSKFMHSNATYFGFESMGFNLIPCGHCLECQNASKQDWETRFAFWLMDLYKRGGCAVMLTFTYNNEHLPHFPNEFPFNNFLSDDGTPLPCFDKEDVKVFLSTLRNRVNRCFLATSQLYKYFLVEEYGSDTKRPHLHVIFGCEKQIDIDVFVELCRDAWNDKENDRERGFMFPKASAIFKKEINGIAYNASNEYVGKNGMLDGRVKIASEKRVAACSYCCKYVLKDLSFYGIDCINEYLNDPQITATERRRRKKIMANYLPCHMQSLNLGTSMLEMLDTDEKKFEALDKGIFNALRGKYVPLPQYIVNKLMYKNVRSQRTTHNDKGKLVHYYDRNLTDFGRAYLSRVFEMRYRKFVDKFDDFIGNVSTHRASFASAFSKDGKFNYFPVEYKKFNECDLYQMPQKLALYSLVIRKLNADYLESFLSTHSLEELFDFELCKHLYVQSKDSVFYIDNYNFVPYGKDIVAAPKFHTIDMGKDFDFSVFGDVDFCFKCYVSVTSYERNRQNEYYKSVFLARMAYKRTQAKYDKKLC